MKVSIKEGIHARIAQDIVKLASKYSEDIFVVKNTSRAEATNIMQVIGLGVSHGDEISIECENLDIKKEFKNNLKKIVNS